MSYGWPICRHNLGVGACPTCDTEARAAHVLLSEKADLIAAAPELLEACKAAEEWINALLDGVHSGPDITGQAERINDLGTNARRLLRAALVKAGER